jgi:hypothetical protein
MRTPPGTIYRRDFNFGEGSDAYNQLSIGRRRKRSRKIALAVEEEGKRIDYLF